MKRRLTLVASPGDVRISHDRTVMGDNITIIEGDFSFGVDGLQRFVDVKLLDASGVSLNQQDVTWTYEDALSTPLKKGDYVLVPFGWANGEYIAKVVSAGTEPTYRGTAPIKQVAARMVSED